MIPEFSPHLETLQCWEPRVSIYLCQCIIPGVYKLLSHFVLTGTP